jgi:hypothetical protein
MKLIRLINTCLKEFYNRGRKGNNLGDALSVRSDLLLYGHCFTSLLKQGTEEPESIRTECNISVCIIS